MVKSLVKNKLLIYQMSKREVIGRYKSSVTGLFWSFFNPILTLIVREAGEVTYSKENLLNPWLVVR